MSAIIAAITNATVSTKIIRLIFSPPFPLLTLSGRANLFSTVRAGRLYRHGSADRAVAFSRWSTAIRVPWGTALTYRGSSRLIGELAGDPFMVAADLTGYRAVYHSFRVGCHIRPRFRSAALLKWCLALAVNTV